MLPGLGLALLWPAACALGPSGEPDPAESVPWEGSPPTVLAGVPVHAEGACDPVATGSVRASGADGPAATLLSGDDGARLLLGGAGGEAARILSGGRVEICGTLEPAASPGLDGRVEVRSVRLLEMGGRPAHLGELVEDEGKYALVLADSGERLPLRAVPARLDERVGAAVWITGRPGPDGWTVESYGVVSGEP